MKVRVMEDEMYPVFFILKDEDDWAKFHDPQFVELSGEQLAEIETAWVSWHKAQEILRDAYDGRET